MQLFLKVHLFKTRLFQVDLSHLQLYTVNTDYKKTTYHPVSVSVLHLQPPPAAVLASPCPGAHHPLSPPPAAVLASPCTGAHHPLSLLPVGQPSPLFPDWRPGAAPRQRYRPSSAGSRPAGARCPHSP